MSDLPPDQHLARILLAAISEHAVPGAFIEQRDDGFVRMEATIGLRDVAADLLASQARPSVALPAPETQRLDKTATPGLRVLGIAAGHRKGRIEIDRSGNVTIKNFVFSDDRFRDDPKAAVKALTEMLLSVTK